MNKTHEFYPLNQIGSNRNESLWWTIAFLEERNGWVIEAGKRGRHNGTKEYFIKALDLASVRKARDFLIEEYLAAQESPYDLPTKVRPEILCVNCDQAAAPFTVYCLDCEAIEISNNTTEELPNEHPAIGVKDGKYTIGDYSMPKGAPKRDKEAARSYTVQFTVTEAEKASLKQLAEYADKTVSSVVRDIVTDEMARNTFLKLHEGWK